MLVKRGAKATLWKPEEAVADLWSRRSRVQVPSLTPCEGIAAVAPDIGPGALTGLSVRTIWVDMAQYENQIVCLSD